MINYLNFINEDKVSDRVKKTIKRFQKNQTIMSEDEVVDYIIKYCDEWLKYPVKILRAINESYFHQKPVKRYSRDNLNYYTMI